MSSPRLVLVCVCLLAVLGGPLVVGVRRAAQPDGTAYALPAARTTAPAVPAAPAKPAPAALERETESPRIQ